MAIHWHILNIIAVSDVIYPQCGSVINIVGKKETHDSQSVIGNTHDAVAHREYL